MTHGRQTRFTLLSPSSDTAIVVAGRSGSAYAAQLGTMQVTEEVDALRSIGVSPMELLVLPKVLGLIVALPLLALYSDVMAVLGGMVMSAAMLDVGYDTFVQRIPEAVSLNSLLTGMGKAPVFAVVIAAETKPPHRASAAAMIGSVMPSRST